MTRAFARAGAVVTGSGAVAGAADPTPFLRMRKLRKFMGRQDDLAVTAAGRALEAASLRGSLGERCGLYLAVGYIPFEASDMEQLLEASLEGDRFSMARFASDGLGAINPLLTFRVLPNMPAFHISVSFDVQGPYVVTYPGVGQFYGALEEALAALESGAIDVALVGGVADQRNALVEHHFSRITPAVPADRLVNAAAFLVVERADDARARGAVPRGRLVDYTLEYHPLDPFAAASSSECLARNGVCLNDGRRFGPASLGLALADPAGGRVTHDVRTRDGFVATSVWEMS
jgi:3-oxoacyl-(acyl-carrier-protein) synthase